MKYRIVEKSPTHYSIQVGLVRNGALQWHQIDTTNSQRDARAILDAREIWARGGVVIEERNIPDAPINTEAVTNINANEPEPINRTAHQHPAAAAAR